jgi:hypothetical protein
VNILGNPRVFSLAYRRALKQHQLELFFEPTLFGADYLIIVPSLFQKFQHDYGFLREHLEPVWRYEREGVTLLEVTLPPKIREDHPLREPVSRLHSQTGRIVLAERRADIPNKVVEAKKKKHAPGFLAFGIRTKVEPGTYRFRALLGVPRPRSREANVPLVELSLTEGCKRAVIDQELPKGDFASVQLLCVIQETQRITPKVYWLGTRSVMLAAIEVEKLPTGGPSSAKLPSAERVHAPSAS